MICSRLTVAAILAAASSAASAEILAQFTTNADVLSSAPADVSEGALESNDSVVVFRESDFTTSGGFTVDHAAAGLVDSNAALVSEMLPDGQQALSYFLHFDTINNDDVVVTATITFDSEILGVLVRDTSLNDTDATLGAGGTTYETGAGPELGSDSFDISADRRTITVTLDVSVAIDRMRVIVDNPTPALVHEYNFEGNGIDNVSGADVIMGMGVEYRDRDNGVPFALGQAFRAGISAGANATGAVPQDEFFELGTSDFTFAFSIRRNQADSGNKDTILDASDINGWQLVFQDGGIIRFNATGYGITYDSPDLGLGSGSGDWNHIAFTCDRSEGDGARWYVNGELVSSDDATLLPAIISDSDLLIGRDSSGVSNTSLDGQLGRLRAYNFALNADEVRAIARDTGMVVDVNPCPADFTGDGVVDASDLPVLLAAWGVCP